MYAIVCYSDYRKENSFSILGVTDTEEKARFQAIKFSSEDLGACRIFKPDEHGGYNDIDVIVEYYGIKLNEDEIIHAVSVVNEGNIVILEDFIISYDFVYRDKILIDPNFEKNVKIYDNNGIIKREIIINFIKYILVNEFIDGCEMDIFTIKKDSYPYAVVKTKLL